MGGARRPRPAPLPRGLPLRHARAAHRPGGPAGHGLRSPRARLRGPGQLLDARRDGPHRHRPPVGARPLRRSALRSRNRALYHRSSAPAEPPRSRRLGAAGLLRGGPGRVDGARGGRAPRSGLGRPAQRPVLARQVPRAAAPLPGHALRAPARAGDLHLLLLQLPPRRRGLRGLLGGAGPQAGGPGGAPAAAAAGALHGRPPPAAPPAAAAAAGGPPSSGPSSPWPRRSRPSTPGAIWPRRAEPGGRGRLSLPRRARGPPPGRPGGAQPIILAS